MINSAKGNFKVMESEMAESGVLEWVGDPTTGVSPSSPIPAAWDGALGRWCHGGQLEGGYGGLGDTYKDR